jgi:tetratricopeptide (TPR) repeat protein
MLGGPPHTSDSDLPSLKATSGSDRFGDLDLPMPKPAGQPIATGLGADLPTLHAGGSAAHGDGFGDIDLPTPAGTGFPGAGPPPFPAPGSSASPGDFGDLDLPAPRLPFGGGAGSPGVGAFGDLELPEPRALSGFPAATPSMMADTPPLAGASDSGSVPRSTTQRSGTGAEVAVGMPGSTGFGELDFGAAADDMEFSDLPQAEAAPAPAAMSAPEPTLELALPSKHAVAIPEAKPKKSRAVLAAGILVGLLLAGGAALGLTPLGVFGIHFIERFMPGAGDESAVRAAIREAEQQATLDGYGDLSDSLSTLGRARREAGLNRELLARSLLHESLFLIRFGNDSRSASRASAVRSRLEERDLDAPELALALAADALRGRQLGQARTGLTRARQHDANDPYLHLVAGELALAEGDLATAAQAFTTATERGAGARGLWGVARARLAGADPAASAAAVDVVLAQSPSHGDALVTKAEMRFDAGDLDSALALAGRVTGRELVNGQRLRVGSAVRARGWTVVGRVEESRGMGTRALAAFDSALRALGSHVPALLGAGRVLLVDRPSDARARFDAVLQAEAAATMTLPNGRTAAQEAQLGAARADLALARAQDAVTSLTALSAARENDAEVLLYLGHAESALEVPNREAAEQHYRAAIAVDPALFNAYVALAELFLAMDRGADADTVLSQAASRVPESASVCLALGSFELRRNRIPAAITQLRRALELDPGLPAAHFSLGVALRRSGQLDEAAASFERLTALDPRHPRLALERGLLFEARGESQRAVDAYRAAWNENHDDMDLLLRLGAALVLAGEMDEAETTLERVRQARPNSAEALHFLGRVSLFRGRSSDALRYFREAVRLDATSAEYRAYCGWAALENNQLGDALAEANAALQRDPTLGDAYWVRGSVRLRSGDPAQALADMQLALQHKPNLYRAEAGMADAYEELGRLPEAVAAFESAVAHDDEQGLWWYRLGRLRMDIGNREPAVAALERATLLGDATTPLPVWLPAAHRLLGEAMRFDGRREDAVRHLERYLAIAPVGDFDRPEVQRLLTQLNPR